MAFIRVPGNPEPDGAVEEWFEGRGGIKLRALFAPSRTSPPRGSVLVCNGRTEFIEKYFEVLRELQQRGFCVFTMDWRGQGLSDRLLPNPLKGHFESMDDPVNDLAMALKSLADRLPRPHIVLAHSMGGCIALRAMQTRRIEVDGAIFSAPMWGIANLSPTARKFARFVKSIGLGGWFAPGVAKTWRRERFKRNPLTHDKTRFALSQALVEEDRRVALAGVTLGWVDAAAEAFEGFSQPGSLAHLRIPVHVLSAGEEALVDNNSHDALAKSLPNAMHVLVEGSKHEILMEVDGVRAQFWREFEELIARMGSSSPRV